MFKKALSIIMLSAAVFYGGMHAACAAKDEIKGSITISGAWALYPMTVKWAEEFRKIHPAVKIDVSAGGAGKGMADSLAGVADIGMVSRAISPAEAQKGAWWVAVARDAVVPTVNEGNPVIEDLLAKGVKREVLVGIWMREPVGNWGGIAGNDRKEPIHVYTRSDACGAAQTWAKYLGGKQEDLQGTGVYGDPGLAGAVQGDALGIGFNNINYAYDAKTLAQVKGIRVLPIDLNANGHIDAGEDFYKNRDDITKAINDGKYPSPPARDLNFVCKGKPVKSPLKEFVKWVLTDGQKYVSETGYIKLSSEKLGGELGKLGVK
jgi:phosphate transport system substrate-binding protein